MKHVSLFVKRYLIAHSIHSLIILSLLSFFLIPSPPLLLSLLSSSFLFSFPLPLIFLSHSLSSSPPSSHSLLVSPLLSVYLEVKKTVDLLLQKDMEIKSPIGVVIDVQKCLLRMLTLNI
jgi:hypothetical protein